MQKVHAGGNALCLLQRRPIEVFASHEPFKRKCTPGIDPKRFERLATECDRRFVCLTQLVAHALGEKLQQVAPIVRVHVKLCSGKSSPSKIGDAARGIAVVDADRDQPQLDRSRRAQDFESYAVAINVRSGIGRDTRSAGFAGARLSEPTSLT
jgi:hypothetical protein